MNKQFTFIILLIGSLYSSALLAEWTIDLSRRTKQFRKQEFQKKNELNSISLLKKEETMGLLSPLKKSNLVEEVVILSTDKGFRPETIRIYNNKKYKIILVNVNRFHKNISFILDSFSQHHSTYFGKMTTFEITPSKEGIFYFQSPETAFQGKLIVHPKSSPLVRRVASQR